MMYESPISQSLLAKLLDTQETDYLCSNAYKFFFALGCNTFFCPNCYWMAFSGDWFWPRN